MIYKFLDQKINYDGTQLRSLFAYMNHGVLGDSIVAFEGACDVSFEHMVDGEDLLARSAIRGGHMLHFIIEMFGKNLELAVTTQRLFASLAFEELTKRVNLEGKPDSTTKSDSGTKMPGSLQSLTILRREGDDIYVGDGKLSISIATVSPVSALIHFAVNVTNENTPVKTACLSDLGVKPGEFAGLLARRFVQELATIGEACCKVRWVR